MYPHTLQGLFDAVAKGSLNDVKEIVESKEFNINHLNEGMNIVNFALTLQTTTPDLENKIAYLIIDALVIPILDINLNVLFHTISIIKNNQLREKIVNILAIIPSLEMFIPFNIFKRLKA